MSTELLATGTSALASSDFTVAAGSSVLVYLKDAAGPTVPLNARVLLQIKEGSEYFTVDTFTGKDPAGVIQGGATTVTYRVYREAGNDAVGAAYV